MSGPDGEQFTTTEPSKYCVRVETPGIVSNVALRLNPGYFITDTFALSLPVRFQFDAGEGSFSHMLIGLRAEFLFSKMSEPTGFPISAFVGATYGQIQAKPKAKDPTRPSPWAISGPLGLHAGINVRWRIVRNFGLILSPEFDVQLPDLLFHGDLAVRRRSGLLSERRGRWLPCRRRLRSTTSPALDRAAGSSAPRPRTPSGRAVRSRVRGRPV